MHTVNLRSEKCSCRAWDLTGIPCQHAICAMIDARVEPMTFISRYYHQATYIASYAKKFQPVRGVKFWAKPPEHPLQPPPICTQPGRPKEKRVRTEEIDRRVRKGVAVQKSFENAQAPSTVPDKLSTYGKIQRCSYCREEGHYKRTCKKFKEVCIHFNLNHLFSLILCKFSSVMCMCYCMCMCCVCVCDVNMDV